ncbi:MAG: NAD-dependent epimerase/dehydratase family protein [Streptosporangiaceae bacterium]
MKVTVIGGTGLIGSQVVRKLTEAGHEAVPAAPSTGVDLITGEGLDAAMDGAEVVINLANSPTFDEASLDFFCGTPALLTTWTAPARSARRRERPSPGWSSVVDLVHLRASQINGCAG